MPSRTQMSGTNTASRLTTRGSRGGIRASRIGRSVLAFINQRPTARMRAVNRRRSLGGSGG